jgi:hypothetical protein
LNLFSTYNAERKIGHNAWLRDGLVLSNWIHSQGQKFGAEELADTAVKFLELWLKEGVHADNYLLRQSRKYFEEYIALVGRDNVTRPSLWLDYCNVLQNLGDHMAASKIILHMLRAFDNDPDYPNYLFFAGVIFKAMGQNDAANNYFFESAQIGPPRLFSKIEMMIIISRNLEEMGTESEESGEDAYKMVHAHLILEGRIDESFDYEEWICSAGTW